MMNTQELIATHGPREAMDYDVVVVGAGPAGLATAIRLKQLAPDASVVVLEKGSEPGAHILSGAVMDPRAMDELFPDWKNRGAPLDQAVTGDDVLFLSETGSTRTPDWLVPRNLHNDGCYVVSLSNVVKWMAQQAEALGVEIFPGFAAAEVLYDEQGCVAGVATGNMGITKEGEPGENFQLGMELRGKYTVFAEGARGHLGKQLLARYKLTEGRDTQTFAIGIKELWEVPAEKAQPGRVVHTAGWPMAGDTFGGGFLYHLADNQVTLGFVIGLDYANPYLSPFEEMQRWKTHPAIRAHIEGGKRIGYGARAINNGTPQALPKTVFPGGALIGCDAGYLNAARIKGSHAAIKSGMLCAEAMAAALAAGRAQDELTAYPEAFEKSWLNAELLQTRNFKLWFKKGKTVGQVMTGVEQWLLPAVSGMTRLEQLKRLDMSDILRQSLPWPLPRRLDEALPSHFTAPTGSRVRIRYQPGQAPAIPVRIQEMFGLGATPCVADGRVPLVVELLSPAQRPLQITADLAAFWAGSYEQVKKEMKGRYPRHYWPDNPLEAMPTRVTKKKMGLQE